MGNQKKAEFVGNIFYIWSFWGGHGELIYTGRYDLPEMLIRRPVEFLTVVTHKLLTVLSRLMYHRKAERVVVQNGIRDFQSFGQSETENWRFVPPLFLPEQNSSASSIVEIS
jgi:hypothetical protein